MPRASDHDIVLVNVQGGSGTCPFRFHPIDEAWQHAACHRVGVNFVTKCDLGEGGPNVPSLIHVGADSLKEMATVCSFPFPIS